MDVTPKRIRVDGTAVAIDNDGVLLRGRSGSGRSDLALRLIDQGARLISDEQVEIERRGQSLILKSPDCMPAHLVGHIEARGIGIMPVPNVVAEVPLRWIVDMTAVHEMERMPEGEQVDILGLSIPLLKLDPTAVSATAKLRLAIKCGADRILGRTS